MPTTQAMAPSHTFAAPTLLRRGSGAPSVVPSVRSAGGVLVVTAISPPGAGSASLDVPASCSPLNDRMIRRSAKFAAMRVRITTTTPIAADCPISKPRNARW